MKKKQTAWERIGLAPDELAKLKFDCEPGLELRIAARALRDAPFWRGFGELLQPEIFNDPSAASFFRLVHEYADKYHVPPEHTIARDLVQNTPAIPDEHRRDVLQFVDNAYSTPLQSSPAYLEIRVKEMARRRAMRAAAVRIVHLNEQPGQDPTDEIADVMAAAMALSTRERHPTYSLRTQFATMLQLADRLAGSAVPTFYLPTLDKALRGGLQAGELGIILAPPHRGKTLTLVNFAAGGVLSGNNVLYLTTEDNVQGVAPRLCSCLTGVPVNLLKDNLPLVYAKLRTILKFVPGDLRMTYRPPGSTGFKEIGAVLDTLAYEDGFRPDLLIIDYMDRLKPPRQRDGAWQELQELYIQARAFSEERGCAIWSASQTKQEGFAKEIVDLDDFGGAFAKGAEADVVIPFCQTKAEKEAGEARLYKAKTRNRESGGVIHVYVDTQRTRLTEVPPGEIMSLVCKQKKGRGGGDKPQSLKGNLAPGTPFNPVPVPGAS